MYIAFFLFIFIVTFVIYQYNLFKWRRLQKNLMKVIKKDPEYVAHDPVLMDRKYRYLRFFLKKPIYTNLINMILSFASRNKVRDFIFTFINEADFAKIENKEKAECVLNKLVKRVRIVVWSWLMLVMIMIVAFISYLVIG